MKTLKYLTICFALCCLFTSNVFGQICFVGINPNIAGLNSDGILALVGYEGETVDYFLNLSLPLSNCPVEDITGFMTLPDGTVVTLPPIPDLNPGDSFDFGGSIIASYVLDPADWGSQPGADADEVRTTVNLFGTAITSPTTTQPAEGFSTFDTEVIPVNAAIQVTKEACPYSKVGDEVIYDITIANIGNVDLDFTSVTDTLLDDGVVEAALLGAGCATLPVGGSCTFSVPYVVQPGDEPGPIVNIIEVTYTHTASGQTAFDDDDAVVELLHPSFTLDVECLEIIDGDALFEVEFCNTGDVDLMVDPDNGQIGPFALPVGPCLPPFFVQVPVDQAVCGASSASLTVAALASITMPPGTPAECQLGNIITPEPAEDSATCTVEVNPDFTANKECLDTSPLDTADGFADFQINFSNTGDVPLLFEINDPAAGYSSIEGPIGPGGSGFVVVQIPTAVQIGCPADDILNAATVTGICVADGTPVRTDPVDATCPGACADFDVVKTCLTTSGLMDGDIATYGIEITNTGTVPLNLIIDDASAEPPLVAVPITLDPGEPYNTTVSRTVVCAEPGQFTIENTVSVVAVAPDGTQIGPKTSTAECPYECGGNEGCTPGFWKNHPACWCDSYTAGMKASDVFTALQDPNYVTLGDDEKPLKSNFDQDTLLDALKYRGGADLAGSVRNLLRHATAALLNGCSSDVAYPVSDALVIELVNFVLDEEDPAMVQELHMILAGYNEDSPCPINAHCERTDVPDGPI